MSRHQEFFVSQIQVLPPPVKAETDLKDYKAIRLANGLTALLISDTRYSLEQLDKEEQEIAASGALDDDDDDSMEDEDSEEDEEYSDDMEEDDDEEGSGDDISVGDNPRRKKASTESGLKKSAAALCVHMGSFSDPEDIPGMAHFLEHMVFMGSKKYPDENSFDSFVEKSGGYDNACTDTETTVFYFEIQRRSFQEGLDRFAQFFTEPLMKKEAMMREREAVASEFKMALPKDFNRKQQLFGSLAKSGHPMAKFMWGNRLSLTPEGISEEEIHRRLHEFKNRHYTAQSMTLCVQAQETLDTLERWVVDSFSEVPNNGLARESFEHLNNPFSTPEFSKLYTIAPIQSVYYLELNWALPVLLEKYRVKPLHYISWILGHEGHGSLVSYLRKRVWALSLTSGNCGDGFEFNSTYSVFSVGVTLTEEGFKNVDKVSEAIFAYIKMMTEEGPSERIYGEIKRIEDLDFKYRDERQPCDNVENVCEMMAFYPSELYLTGDELMFEFDAKEIESCMSYLTPEAVNVIVMAEEHNKSCDLVEPWFKTKYAVKDIPEPWRDSWREPKEGISEMHLPKENQYIAEDISLKALADEVPKYPIKIVDDQRGEMFFREDNIFRRPRATMKFYLVSPEPLTSLHAATCLDLLSNVICQVMIEETYPADQAQLHFTLYSSEEGLVIKVSGLNDKLSLILSTVFKYVKDAESLCSDALFEAVKAQTKKSYYNFIIKPMKLVKQVRMQVLQKVFYPTTSRYAIVSDVTKDEVFRFADKMLSRCFIQGLAQGNMSSSEAKAAFEMCHSILKLGTLPREDFPHQQCHILKEGDAYLRVEGLNPIDGNTVVTNYYQEGPGQLRSHAILEVVNSLMTEPVFETLRTQEQLGYSVFSMLRNSFGISGFSITICAEASKHTPDFIDSRIEAFLDWFLKEKLDALTEDEFQAKIQSLIKARKSADVTLEDEASRNWGEIVTTEYLFNRYEKDIETFESLTSKTVAIETLKKLITGGELFKKLSVQVVGNSSGVPEDDSPKEQGRESIFITLRDGELPDRTFKLVYLNTTDPKHIAEVDVYRSNLAIYPVHKIID